MGIGMSSLYLIGHPPSDIIDICTCMHWESLIWRQINIELNVSIALGIKLCYSAVLKANTNITDWIGLE